MGDSPLFGHIWMARFMSLPLCPYVGVLLFIGSQFLLSVEIKAWSTNGDAVFFMSPFFLKLAKVNALECV